MPKVFINPGHCPGVDPGAVNNRYGVTEAHTVAIIGDAVKKYLEAAGCEVVLLQSDNLMGENPKYPNICQTANESGADVFVSIHCNAATPAAEGTETLVYSAYGAAGRLANCIHQQIIDNLDVINRGIKVRPDLAVLRETIMPAVLVECAFISNEHDVQLLMYRRDDFARAIARGVTDYFQTDYFQTAQ